MHLYLDSANISDAQAAAAHGIMHGLTTNPSLIAKEPPHPLGYLGHLRDLVRAVTPDAPISIQPPLDELSASPRECVGTIMGMLQSRRPMIKIPISWDTLPLIKAVAPIAPVNATCVYTPEQAIAAIHAGAKYVSFFWCRMNDVVSAELADMSVVQVLKLGEREPDHRLGYNNGGSKAAFAVNQVRTLIDRERLPVQIIAGSIRTPADVMAAFSAGAHIVTTSLSVLKQCCFNDHSNTSAQAFENSHKKYSEACAALREEQAKAEEDALKAVEAKPSDQGHSPEPPPPEAA